jgi:hypothetical protein
LCLYDLEFQRPFVALDPDENSLEPFELECRFNTQNGSTAHQILADFVAMRQDLFPDYASERPIFSGTEPIWPRVESAFKGRPDASRKMSPNTTQVFDWKPVTHHGNVRLQAKDAAQFAAWQAEATRNGKLVLGADTSSMLPLESGLYIKKMLGSDIDGRYPVFDIVAYGSRVPGVAYYDLRDTGMWEDCLDSATLRESVTDALDAENGRKPPLRLEH